jgi:uncharacterized membrane protein YeaQ/YmgE (transglycosylase-associated protein family)
MHASKHCRRVTPDSLGRCVVLRESMAKKQYGDQSSRLLLYEGHQSCRVLAVEGGLGRSISGTQIAPFAGVVPPFVSLIIQLISGAVGGNVAGAAMKESSLGTLGNSIAGIVGGGLGGTILQMVMGTAAAGGGSLDLTTILSNVAGGGVGGAILMAIVGIIKNKMAAK